MDGAPGLRLLMSGAALEDVVDRDAAEDDRQADEGVSRVVVDGEDRNSDRREDEDRGQDRVADHAEGAFGWIVAAAEDEDRRYSQAVEEPHREDGEREERLESPDEQQQQRGQRRLQDERGVGRLEATTRRRWRPC